MEYSFLISELEGAKELNPAYKEFQGKILCTQKRIIGVRTPVMRKIARAHRGGYYSLKPFPDGVYEVDFIKVCLAAELKYDELVKELGFLVNIMDCWALTDVFSSREILENKAAFKEHIVKLLRGGDFSKRLALVILLKYYVDDENIPYALKCVEECDASSYYVSMAAAWLVAEIIIKNYSVGVEFLKRQTLDKSTHNRAIQKCRDSFRLNGSQKEELKSLKRN